MAKALWDTFSRKRRGVICMEAGVGFHLAGLKWSELSKSIRKKLKPHVLYYGKRFR